MQKYKMKKYKMKKQKNEKVWHEKGPAGRIRMWEICAAETVDGSVLKLHYYRIVEFPFYYFSFFREDLIQDITKRFLNDIKSCRGYAFI